MEIFLASIGIFVGAAIVAAPIVVMIFLLFQLIRSGKCLLYRLTYNPFKGAQKLRKQQRAAAASQLHMAGASAVATQETPHQSEPEKYDGHQAQVKAIKDFETRMAARTHKAVSPAEPGWIKSKEQPAPLTYSDIKPRQLPAAKPTLPDPDRFGTIDPGLSGRPLADPNIIDLHFKESDDASLSD